VIAGATKAETPANFRNSLRIQSIAGPKVALWSVPARAS